MKLDSSHRVNWHLHKLSASSTSKPYKGSSHFALLSETVFLNFWGAPESIPTAYVAWQAGTTALFLLGSCPPLTIDCSKIPAQSGNKFEEGLAFLLSSHPASKFHPFPQHYLPLSLLVFPLCMEQVQPAYESWWERGWVEPNDDIQNFRNLPIYRGR